MAFAKFGLRTVAPGPCYASRTQIDTCFGPTARQRRDDRIALLRHGESSALQTSIAYTRARSLELGNAQCRCAQDGIRVLPERCTVADMRRRRAALEAQCGATNDFCDEFRIVETKSRIANPETLARAKFLDSTSVIPIRNPLRTTNYGDSFATTQLQASEEAARAGKKETERRETTPQRQSPATHPSGSAQMSKGMNRKKEDKKKPAKSLEEKRAMKKAKKESRNSNGLLP